MCLNKIYYRSRIEKHTPTLGYEPFIIHYRSLRIELT